MFVYVGRTNDFERRKREHLTDRTRKTKHPAGSIKEWLQQQRKAGLEPKFFILEIVETEEESLLSETKWVEKLAAIRHPLRDRWKEHQELIAQGIPTEFEALIFSGRKVQKVGQGGPNKRRSGSFVDVPEGVTITGPVRIELLPPKGQK